MRFMISILSKIPTVALLVTEENLHGNIVKRRVVQTSTTNFPAFQKLRGRAE